jgi:hypothetical protein
VQKIAEKIARARRSEKAIAHPPLTEASSPVAVFESKQQKMRLAMFDEAHNRWGITRR